MEIYGIYDGKLSDRGEELALFARNGTLIFQVQYADRDGWPLSADGAGDSIVLDIEASDSQTSSSWRASRDLYGSPGKVEGSRH